MHWICLRLFQSILSVCLWSIGIVYSLAYTPPFEGKYKSGTIDGGNPSLPAYSKTGVWYDKMKAVWG
ncbi:MAG: hypothetical protein LBE99_01495, partial [Puniceicoccales bacterium]|nr:hypothetical protein [Puniceicoccales bacterium]